MVNYKLFSLPLLVGFLMQSRRASATCTITYSSGYVTEGCANDNSDDGYYWVESKTKVVKYVKAETTPKEVTGKGYYLTKEKIFCDIGITTQDEHTKKTVSGLAKGYYRNENNDIYACNGSECNAVDAADSCNEANIGKIVKKGNNYGLCLTSQKIGDTEYSPVLEFVAFSSQKEDDEKKLKYLVKHTEKSNEKVFSYDKEKNYYVINRSIYAIALDATNIYYKAGTGDNIVVGGSIAISENDFICMDVSNGLIINRKKDFCTSTSSGKYFKCKDGLCTSYEQSTYNEQELNDERCVFDEKKQELYIYKGRCTVTTNNSKEYYLIQNGDTANIVTSESGNSGNKLAYLATYEGSKYKIEGYQNNMVGYYLNADLSTKKDYPLILCDGTTCKLTKPENGLGYYITNTLTTSTNKNVELLESVIKCTSESKCIKIETIPSTCSTIGEIIFSNNVVSICERIPSSGVPIGNIKENKINTDEAFEKEQILLNVSAGNFPGVTTVGNYIVKMVRAKEGATATVTLVEKEDSCVNDHDIVKYNGKFYYCAGGIRVPFEENGAKFAILRNSLPVIVEMKENEYITKCVDDNTVNFERKNLDENDLGYYVDRSNGAAGIIECSEKTEDNGTKKKTCESISDVFSDYVQAFTSKEENFPTSATDSTKLTSKLIVCSDSKCKVPSLEGNVYKIGDKVYYTKSNGVEASFFYNSKKELIDCNNDDCNTKKNTIVATGKIKEGLYINGGKDLSLIRCEDKKDGDNKIESVECEPFDVPSYSYYVSYDKKLIKCDKESCSISSSLGSGIKNYINGDEKSAKKIIECNNPVNNNRCEEKKAAYYYVNDDNKSNMSLIYCGTDGSSCKRTEGINRGVFISGDDENNRLIKCSIKNDCQIIYNVDEPLIASSAPDNKKYFLNGDSTGARIITVIDHEEGQANASRKRDDKKKWGFPQEAVAKANGVYLNGNGDNIGRENAIIFCASENSCEELTPPSTSSKYIDPSDSKIIEFNSGAWESNIILNGETSGTRNYIFNKATGMIVTADGGIGSLIVCTKETSSTTAKCEIKTDGDNFTIDSNNNGLIMYSNNIFTLQKTNLAKGYYINSEENIIAWDGSDLNNAAKGTECNESNVGKIISSNNQLCILGKGENDQPVAVGISDTKKYIIKTGSTGAFPGESQNGIMISVGDNRIVKTKDSGFYLIKDYDRTIITNSDEGELNLCKDGDCSNKMPTLASGNEKFYPNADSNGASTIKCYYDDDQKKVKCALFTPSNEEVYCLKSNNLYSCNGKCDSTECYLLTHKNGYYLPATLNGLISCTADSTCSMKGKSDIKEGYYKSEDNNRPLVRCNLSNGDIRCNYEKTVNNGSYIGGETSIINCLNNVCTKSDLNEGFYISGEVGQQIIHCSKPSGSTNIICNSEAKPAEGWYKKVGNSNNELIKCYKSSNGTINCESHKISGNGNYIYAINKSYIINCYNNSCSLIEIPQSGYNINGETNQLIYCFGSQRKDCVAENGNGWYIKGVTTSTFIYCNNGCKEYESGNIKKGYYLNANSRITNEKLLKNEGNEITSINPKTGWYMNADLNDSKRIIECIKSQTGTVCESINLANSCGTGNTGKFIEDNGEIKWCDGNKLIKMENNNKVLVNINSKTLGIESKGVAVFEIASDSVIQSSIDGYAYDSNSSILYFCKNYGDKLCEKVQDPITPGYYINYSGSDNIIKCTGESDKKCVLVNAPTQCNESNIIKSEGNFKLCLNNINGSSDDNNDNINKIEDMKNDIEEEQLYALENRAYSFPKKESTPQFRYFLANVNKYYIRYNKSINEVTTCTEADSEAKNKVCMKKDNTLVLVKDLLTTSYNGKSLNGQINSNELLEEIQYDADTNSGYFIYSNEYRKSITGAQVKVSVLTKKYIPMSENRVDYKLECPIGGICVRREKAEEPILGYKEENGILKRQKRNENNAKEVTEKIMPGTYMIYDGNTKVTDYAIKCSAESGNMKCTKEALNGLSIVGGVLKHKSGVQASKLFSKFIYSISNALSRREVDDSEFNIVINELSATSYSDIEFNSSKNIFLFGGGDRMYSQITNDVLSSDEETKVVGFMCNIESRCKAIETSGNIKYFINSIQEGKAENAVVKCGGNGSNKICTFIKAKNGNIYENYAATSVDNALITCTDNGCTTTSALATEKLPDCKYYNNIPFTDIYGNYVREDNGVSLLDGQHCVLNGIIYKNKAGRVSISSSGPNIKIFDASLREVKVENIKEDHYGAIMYSCPTNNNCYVTYGYVYAKNANKYLKCIMGECRYLPVGKLYTTCKEAGDGAVINSEGLSLCAGEKARKMEKGAYVADINVSENFPETEIGDKILINVQLITSTNVYTYTMVKSDGFFLLNNKNIIINDINEDVNDSTQNTLVSCTEKRCEYVPESDNGYYRSYTYPKLLIKCKDNGCGTVKDGIVESKIEYTNGPSEDLFFYENKYYYVSSKFYGSDYQVLAEASKYKITPLVADNFVLLNNYENILAGASESRDLKKLYSCNSSIKRCVKVETVEDGWYISGQEGYNAIKCVKGACTMVKDLNKNCSGAGDLILSSGVPNFCIVKNNKATAVKLSENVGKVADLNGPKLVFPNDKTYVIIYTNKVIGTGYVDSSNTSQVGSGIAQCKNDKCVLESTGKDVGEGKYCIYNGSIYSNTTDANQVYKCIKQFTEGVSVEVFDGNTLISTNNDAKKKGVQMYYCNDGSCRVTTGYKKYAGGNVICNYDGCDTSASKSVPSKSVKGVLYSGPKIYTDVTPNGINPYTSSSGKKNYFFISGYNEFPGTETYKSFVVEAGDTYIVPFIGNGYYLINKDGQLLNIDPTAKADNDPKSDKNTNILMLCDSTEKTCTKPTVNDLGSNYIYLKNAAVTESNKLSMILCVNGKCDLADSNTVIFEESYTNCNVTGQLVRTAAENAKKEMVYSTYKLCTARKTKPVEINVEKSKYYMLSLTRNDTFAGVAFPDEVKYENSERKVLVEVNSGYVREFEKEGYVLYNPAGNEVVSTVGSSSNKYVLYYCEETGITGINDSNKSYECKQVSSVDNGWYFNSIFGDKRVIRCIEKVCGIIEVKESAKCVNSGSIIYNNGFKVCQSIKKQLDVGDSVGSNDGYGVIVNVSLNTEFPGLKSNNTDILLSIMKNKVSQVKMKTNVVVRNDKTVLTESYDSGILYECTEDGCVENLIPKDNWYMKKNETGYNNELVYCINRRCRVYKNENDNNFKDLKQGFRVNANINKPLIQCVPNEKLNDDKTAYEQTDKAFCLEREFSEGWFINARHDIESIPLIKCTTESGCNTMGSVRDGFYINAGADNKYNFDAYSTNSYKGIIKCTGNTCEQYSDVVSGSTCAKGGDIVNPSKGTYKLCKEAGKTPIDFSKSGGYDVINNESGFPGNSGTVVVKISNNEIVTVSDGYYYISNKMYECSGSCNLLNGDDKDGVIVFDTVNSVLYTASCNGGECTWSENKTKGNVFLDDNNKLIVSTAVEVSKIYQCEENSSKKIVCKDVLSDNVYGYFFNNENLNTNTNAKEVALYKCEGTSCNVVEEVRKCTALSYKQNYCYVSYLDEPYDGEGDTNIPAQSICKSDANKYYFALSEINTGVDKVNCIATDTVSGYFKVNYYIYYQNPYSTRIVNTRDNIIDGLKTTSVIKDGYSTDKLNTVLNEANGNMITCNGEKCELGKILSCTYNYKTEKCTVSGGNVNAGQICLSPENNIYLALERLSSSGGRCVRHNTSWGYSLGSNTVSPDYSNVDQYAYSERYEPTYHLIDGKIYKLENDGDVYVMGEGAYLIDSANKLVDPKSQVDISKGSQFNLYICTSNGCKIKNACNSVTDYEYIYYNKYSMLQCDPKTTTISKVVMNGYFLNGPWENLIRCVGSKCTVYDNDNGMEGYYLDDGNKEKVIKCIRDGDKFKCQLEDPVLCEYTAKEETCKGEVDLLRNSYCYHIKKDKGRVIEQGKMLYVENFIRANEKGKCISNEGNDEIYYHYRKSKFLGNKERDEIIRYSKGAIVSVYEKKLGYYIITTDTRKGLTASSTALNKSRLYECTSKGCVEIREPVENRIYINKASEMKMVIYRNGYWTVMQNRCVKNKENPGQCTLPSEGINKGEFIYIYDSGESDPVIYATKVTLKTKNTVIDNEYNNEIDPKKYQFIKGYGLYTFDKSKQFFDVVKDHGYYMFINNDYTHNLEPFKSTVNTTYTGNIIVYKGSGSSWTTTVGLNNYREGFYWNKADMEGEGIVIQVMDVPKKLTPPEVEGDDSMRKREVEDEAETEDEKEKSELNDDEKELDDQTEIIEESENNLVKREENEAPVRKYKAAINGCVSVKKGTCTPKVEGQKFAIGNACVVVDGENRGLYLAIGNIEKNSNGKNCMKYESETTYYYIQSSIEFNSEPHERIIVEVNKNEITPFVDESKYHGYFVFDKSESKVLASTASTLVNSYNCTYEYEYYPEGESNAGEIIPDSENFVCETFNLNSKYYYGKGQYNNGSNAVLSAKDKTKWNVESKRGYYFFNKGYLPSKFNVVDEKKVPDDVTYSKEIGTGSMRYGTFLNAAADNEYIVKYETSGKTVLTEYKTCTPSGETCNTKANSDVNKDLVNGDICLSTGSKKSLYLIIVDESDENNKKTMCYTGSEKLKYRFVNNMLFRLDGLSVQEVTQGYYVLNDKGEEFSATYPETPAAVYYCDGSRCEDKTDGLDINSEVVFNNAATGNNKMLKYYANVNKYVNVFKPGYYLVNERSEITDDYTHRYYLTESGELTSLPGTYSYENIYVNNAKSGLLTWRHTIFEDSRARYSGKVDGVEYDGYVNRDTEEDVYVFIQGYLYRQLTTSFELVSDGLYAIKDGKAFKSYDWESLSTGSEICYISGGTCSSSKLSTVIQNGYAINKATKRETVIQYDKSLQKWRLVSENGVYFFFEDGNSISATDRRIARVMEVVDGDAIDITKDANRYGFYKYDNLMIESNKNDNWEDAVVAIGTVESDNKRVCNSYETDEIIGIDKFCFNSTLGVCMPKVDISNDVTDVESNCAFSDGVESYYFLLDENLYSVSDHSLKSIVKDGLYIVNTEKKVFEDKLESKATAYACESGKCKVDNELSTGFYLNMANGGLEEPVILYYNDSSKTWRKVIVDGYYFFNAKGYAARDGDKINAAYVIEDKGNPVSVLDSTVKGIFINQSSGNENIVVENNGKWENAKSVPSCSISNEGKVTVDVEMKPGEICLDGKQIVLIKPSATETTDQSNDTQNTDTQNNDIQDNTLSSGRKKREFSYDGVSASADEAKYNFDAEEETLVKLEDGKILNVDITGYVIIDNDKSLPIESTEGVSASIYKCSKSLCKVVSSVETGKRYINALSDDYPLVVYEGSGNWKIETTEGYYFLGNDMVVVNENTIVNSAVAVKSSPTGEIEQTDISGSKELGFYFNKASPKKIIVSNDEEFWAKGIAVRNCNVTEVKEGINCRPVKGSKITTIDIGDYCYDDENEMLFLLIGNSDIENEEDANCVAGTNEVPVYLSPEKAAVINNNSVGSKLVELTSESIKVVSPGLYILNVNGTVVDNNNGGDDEITIWNCDESECENVKMDENVMFLSQTGEIFKMETEEEKSILVKVEDEGIYYFTPENKACSASGDEVATIVKISKDGESTLIEEVDIESIAEGSYVNNANNNTLVIKSDGEWSIVENECTINEEKNSCESENVDMEVGSLCIINGSIHVVSEVDTENEIAKCVAGSDEVPLFLKDEDGKLTAVKKSSVNIIDEEGYYAINSATMEGLKSESPVKAMFVKCDEDGECANVKPVKASNYLNKAVADGNVVSFATGSVKEAITTEKKCVVSNEKCSAAEGEIAGGDMCVADGSLYLVKSEDECVKVEKYIKRLQFVGGKIYSLIDDTVIQVFDGYYFMNGDNRVIGSSEDYASPDTIGYMCSKKGDCYIIDPDGVKYYKDYATEVNGKFKVVKYDPEKKSKRDENSGYEIITKEGIYKLDDGSYVDCEVEASEEVSCKNITEVGSMVTIDGEIILCAKNDEKQIECAQATKGGYYLINDVLLECEAGEDGEKLECEEIKKEGYFLADGEKVLYSCEEKLEEVNISSYDILGVNELIENETDSVQYEETVDEVMYVKREEENDNTPANDNAPADGDTQNNDEGQIDENQPAESEQPAEGEQPVEGDQPEEPKEEEDVPKDVTCRVIECVEGQKVTTGGDENAELYVCLKKTKEVDENKDDEDGNKPEENGTDDENNTEEEDEDEDEDEDEGLYWSFNKDLCADTVNVVKKGDTFTCDDEKKDVSEEFIEKPNEEHAQTEKSTKTTTAKTTTTPTPEVTTTTSSTTSSEVSTTPTTQKDTTTTGKTTESPKPTTGADQEQKTTTTTTTTTQAAKTTTTTTKASSSSPTQGSGAGSVIRSIPSLSLYLLLFVFALFIQL